MSMGDVLHTPVTVVIVNYQGASWIDECLDAVAALQGNVVEVLVVDNASTDDGPEHIAAHSLSSRLIAMGSNAGPCPARNRGLQEAQTHWVLAVDSDVIVPPDTLLRLLPETALDRVAVVQPRAVLAHDTSVVHYDGGDMHYVGVMCLDNLLAVPQEPAGEAEDIDAVISMALLVDREALLDAGGFDPTFFILFEDHDLSYRLRALGWRLRRVPQAHVFHREGTAGISFRPGAPSYPGHRAFLHGRNRAYLVLKNYSWPALLLSWPGRFAYASVWFGFALSRGLLLDYLRGRLEVLKFLPQALRYRRQLAARRVVADRDLLHCRELTFSPVINQSRVEAFLLGGLNRLLQGWWRCVRPLLPRSIPVAVPQASEEAS
ncbi:MAG: GT2 family glycosyltransferase [Pseudohongiellaceae bacterium]|jgi:GT2 family glycosyltransferase